jgi:hypothetical protein
VDAMARTLRNPAPPGSRGRDRAAAMFLLALMVIGSPVLWIGVPVACSWVAAQLTADATTHLQIVVPLTILGMVLFARLLFWINKLYLRVLAQETGLEPEDDAEEDRPRYARGPLEPILVASLVVALIALTVWFFAFAENPSHQIF